MSVLQLRAGVYARQSSGAAKSIDDQISECTADAGAQGWTVVETYQDGSSASRYARRARDDWARVLADITSGALGVLILWESSRGDRDLPTWAALLATCRERGVQIRVTTHSRTYDVGNARDWRSLAEDGVDSAYESEKTSVRARRGVASAAAKGRPAAGPCPYGYRRTYDPHSGVLAGQEPDPATAAVVARIIGQAAHSVAISKITDALNEEGVPPPAGRRWYRQRVRLIALNEAYIGRRRHKATSYAAGWEPLVDEATFYAAARVLREPARMATARPGRQVHLLTYLAQCHHGHPLTARATYYLCRTGCAQIPREQLDDYITALAVARLSLPDAYSALRQAGADADKQVLAARGEAARLRSELDTWRRSAALGQTTPASLAVIEAELTGAIKAADTLAERAAVAPALRQMLDPGADVQARWDASALPARREVLRTLMDIRVRPTGRNAYVPVEARVDIDWRST